MSGLEFAVLNHDHLTDISDGDREFEREIVEAFLESAEALLPGLSGPDALRTIHTLKGSARSAGADRVGAIAAEIEASMRGAAATTDQLERITAALAEVRAAALAMA